MAIDLQQERQQERRQAAPPALPRPRGTAWVVAVALVVVVVVGAALSVLADEPAPAGRVTTLSYPEGAFTAEREGGPYLVVPERVAGFADTWVQVRESGPYAPTTRYADTLVQIREG